MTKIQEQLVSIAGTFKSRSTKDLLKISEVVGTFNSTLIDELKIRKNKLGI